jgi:hypothetical protein
LVPYLAAVRLDYSRLLFDNGFVRQPHAFCNPQDGCEEFGLQKLWATATAGAGWSDCTENGGQGPIAFTE